ncbi:TPA: hypothetical protein SMR62_001483 [Proteus mirabilis]|uniref:hypothetical protein n=1 Tax=Proteus mirabilis TaxID=584 RepID=UPI0020238DE3|nr:hypothetical protein [Proteus mirabilis]MDF7232319.1 hypothetical protein [Proteus mirabilis]HBN5549204.1 hypothetical protein [Proteus mirabilis]HCB2901141.1 hypothetical protein [Proteus mirabilis]HCB2910497.1 hypothetical protein [Proteus mirabilis]HCD1104135.1 hypothetical protein [Proteus mirabilis]
MKLGETTVSVGIILMMTICIVWQSNQLDKLSESVTKLGKDKSSLTEQLSRQNSITENANRTFRIINNVSSLNSEERNRSAVDSEKVKTVIKTVLVNNDCANTAIPNDALIRMHDYSERIRASGTHSDTGTPNR